MADENNGGGELVPVPPNEAVSPLQDFLRSFATNEYPVVCSFDSKTDEGQQILQKCQEASDAKLRGMVNMEFDLVHFYGRKYDRIDPVTNEVKTLLRVCVVTSEGEVYDCSSGGVRDSIFRFVGTRGMGNWTPPIKVRVRQQELNGGKMRLWLEQIFPKKGGAK